MNAIVDVDAAGRAGWTPIDLASAFLEGGARFLQVRAKLLGSAAFLDIADAIVERARAFGALVVINDRADIARLSDAAGVHVGQDDLSPRSVRAVIGDEAMVGLSTHTETQVALALDQPITYLAIGPVFGSATKATGYDAVGLERVADAARRAAVRRIPVVAIGGITLANARSVIEAGAASVAVISDLVTTARPAARVAEFVSILAA